MANAFHRHEMKRRPAPTPLSARRSIRVSPSNNNTRTLTVPSLIPAATVAANVLDLFADVAVDNEGHVVIVRGLLLASERFHSDQVKRVLLRLLHYHAGGRAAPVAGGKPSPVHDGACGIRHKKKLAGWRTVRTTKTQRRKESCV